MTDPWRMVGEDGLTPPQRLVEAIFERLRRDIAWANRRSLAVQRAAALATLRFTQHPCFVLYCEIMDAEPGRVAAGLLSGFCARVLRWLERRTTDAEPEVVSEWMRLARSGLGRRKPRARRAHPRDLALR